MKTASKTQLVLLLLAITLFAFVSAQQQENTTLAQSRECGQSIVLHSSGMLGPLLILGVTMAGILTGNHVLSVIAGVLSWLDSECLRKRVDDFEVLGVSLTPENYFNRAADLYYKGNFEFSLKAFEKAIQLKPDWAEAWNNKGILLGKLGKHDKALKAAETAIELKPDLGGGWYTCACAYARKGNKEKAISDLKKAIKLDVSYKKDAKTDEDFKLLRRNAGFKKLTE